MDTELRAFTAESAAIDRTLLAIPPDRWPEPALGEWTMGELVAHLTRGARLLSEYGAGPVDADTAAVDRVAYFRMDLVAAAPAIATRARAEAQDVDPVTWPQRFADAWRASAATYERVGPDRLVSTPRGPMGAREYLATRVLELCVHHMDVCAALDLPPVSTPEAGRVTLEILEGLLGERRPRNYGRARFILAATGRLVVDDPRFPVLR